MCLKDKTIFQSSDIVDQLASKHCSKDYNISLTATPFKFKNE